MSGIGVYTCGPLGGASCQAVRRDSIKPAILIDSQNWGQFIQRWSLTSWGASEL